MCPAPRVDSWVIPPYPSITQHIIRFGLYQVDRNRQTKPLLYEVPILTPDDTLEETNVVVRAGYMNSMLHGPILIESLHSNEEMYVTSEGEEWGSNGFFAPPKQRWWMR